MLFLLSLTLCLCLCLLSDLRSHRPSSTSVDNSPIQMYQSHQPHQQFHQGVPSTGSKEDFFVMLQNALTPFYVMPSSMAPSATHMVPVVFNDVNEFQRYQMMNPGVVYPQRKTETERAAQIAFPHLCCSMLLLHSGPMMIPSEAVSVASAVQGGRPMVAGHTQA